MGKLNFWTQDSDGERWLINGPSIVVATNRPRKKGKRKMYTNRPKHGTKAWMSYIRGLRKGKKNSGRKRKSKARRNMYSAGEVANRPRTRTVTRYVKVRRNKPSGGGVRGMFGGLLPGLEPIAGAFAGLVVPPVLRYFTASYIPASIQANPIGKYLVKAAYAALPAWAVKKYVNRSVGNTMMVVGLGKVLFDAVREFAPGIPGLSEGVGYQPMLGAYGNRPGFPQLRPVPMMQSQMVAGVPDRLQPGARF